MPHLFYKNKPLIGLDVSQTGIKVMSINQKRSLIQGYGSLDLDPAKTQTSLDDENDNYLLDNLRSLLEQNIVGTVSSDHVVVGIPTSRTFSRAFSVPANDESHIKGAVQVEVERYIPMPADSLYIDYQIVKKTKEKIIVVLAAAQKSVVDSVLKTVRDAGLLPVAIEPSINATARVLTSTEEGHLATLIVDIGTTSTDIAVLDEGAIRITGSASVGGNSFTLDISSRLGISLEKAHQYKVLNGLSSGPQREKIETALTPSLKKIANEMRKVIRYYSERLVDERTIEQIVIVGGGANVPGIGDFFTNELVMPARVASPWQNFDFGNLQKPNRQFRPRYIAVAGLASVSPAEVWG